MEFSDGTLCSGTGFLVDKMFFVTAAHCVRDENNLPAKSINVVFGMNGINELETKKIVFHGEDFWVPAEYNTAYDENDIALLDLQKIFIRELDINLGPGGICYKKEQGKPEETKLKERKDSSDCPW